MVIALIAVFARGGAAPLDPGTPEGVVQRYSQAVVDGDAQTALTYLVPEVADVVRDAMLSERRPADHVLETTERDDSARASVLVVTVYGRVRSARTSTRARTSFELVRVGGDWLVEARALAAGRLRRRWDDADVERSAGARLERPCAVGRAPHHPLRHPVRSRRRRRRRA